VTFSKFKPDAQGRIASSSLLDVAEPVDQHSPHFWWHSIGSSTTQQNVELLKRVVAETGGKYYPLQKANSLIDDLTYLEGNVLSG
jgi:hypothetical protein